MTNPCVDLSDLRELTDGDPEIEAELFEEFISSSNELVEILKTSTQANNNESWRKAAHALKGIAGNLGAAQLSEYALQAQEAFESSPESKQELYQKINAEHQDVLEFLKNA